MREGGQNFLDRLFSPSEVDGATAEHLAGVFAAKEAACKALQIPSGNWHAFHVSYKNNGAPHISVDLPEVILGDVSVSISHDGDYAFAVVIAHNESSS